MGLHVEPNIRTSVAVGVLVARAHNNVTDGVVYSVRVTSRQPVLGRSVAVVEDDGRQPWDRVIQVSDTVLGAGLVGDKVGKRRVAHTRRAKGVDIVGIARITEVRAGKGRNGTTERVARDDQAVARVVAEGGGHGGGNAVRDLVPGITEAGVDLSAVGEVVVFERKDDIGDEVADVVAATHGDDDFATGVVEADVGANPGIVTTAEGVSMLLVDMFLHEKAYTKESTTVTPSPSTAGQKLSQVTVDPAGVS